MLFRSKPAGASFDPNFFLGTITVTNISDPVETCGADEFGYNCESSVSQPAVDMVNITEAYYNRATFGDDAGLPARFLGECHRTAASGYREVLLWRIFGHFKPGHRSL